MNTITETAVLPMSTGKSVGRDGEQSRARYPDTEGFVERDGQRLFYEVYGEGEETIFLLPTWSLVHSRHWKMQIAYFARHFRVLVMDGLGNGRSDRAGDPRRYAPVEFARDCLAVMDATGTERAVMVSALARAPSTNSSWRASRPERLLGAVFIGPVFPYTPSHRWSLQTGSLFPSLLQLPAPVLPMVGAHERRPLAQELPGVRRSGSSRAASPSRTRRRRSRTAVGWALETDPETLIATSAHGECPSAAARTLRGLARSLDCPVLVISGDRDKITPPRDARALARLSGGKLETVKGGGHFPHARKPVRSTWCCAISPRTPSDARARRATQPCIAPTVVPVRCSSPRRSGSATPSATWRSRASCAACTPTCRSTGSPRIRSPGYWRPKGERIHPASAHLANESKHIESESAEHDLHCFHALRRMDEILAANFMLFHDVVREQRYDLWIGDEAWELDYYLHENPREKRVPFAWLTDFVGFLPMADGGPREGYLTADYNADMVDHIAEHPEVRDMALFVGNPDDIVSERLGPELPMIRDWTERHFDFTGYVTGFDPADLGERTKLRAELGYSDDEQVCIVTVGGSGVGADLLRRVIAAFPQAKERVPDLRMIVVAGPRIDPDSLASHAGTRGGPLRAQPLPAPGRLRPRRGARRAHDLDGADGEQATVPLLPLAPSLRAELPRPPSPRKLWRGPADGLRRLATRADRRGDSTGDRPRRGLPRRGGRRRRHGGAADRRAAVALATQHAPCTPRFVSLPATVGYRPGQGHG